MVEHYWSLKTKEHKTDTFESNTLASQPTQLFTSSGNWIGFRCQDNQADDYLIRMKKREIKSREAEIKRIQKEIEKINKMSLK